MSPSLIVEILLGLVAAVLGYNTFRSATQANREQARAAVAASNAAAATLDATAGTRAAQIYDSIIEQLTAERADLRQQVTRLLAELVSTRDEIHSLRQSNDQLRGEIAPLRRSNERLQSEITLLRAEIVKLTAAETDRGNH